MKGFVPTPNAMVDAMVDKLFRVRPPEAGDRLLDPGCGEGAFIAGVIRWCTKRGTELPRITGIESDPRHILAARTAFSGTRQVEIRECDFLLELPERYDYIIGNPPYVPITSLTRVERESFRQRFSTAKGRFDLYLLFFDQALRSLSEGARLVFITPEKFLYVDTADALRCMLGDFFIEELHFVDEATFPGLVTYPLISTIVKAPSREETRVLHRDGRSTQTMLGQTSLSWLPLVRGASSSKPAYVLADLCNRISCGVATGADDVFVTPTSELSADLLEFAYPTIAGRQITRHTEIRSSHSMLVPYGNDGTLLQETGLGALGDFLRSQKQRLLSRTCARRKPWYAFHESPPLKEILRPKLLCKDIVEEPFFVVDRGGFLVPRHSVYYLTPKSSELLEPLCDYLNSSDAREWLRDHCQRAANGFLRLQSSVLKRLPVPRELVDIVSGDRMQIETRRSA